MSQLDYKKWSTHIKSLPPGDHVVRIDQYKTIQLNMSESRRISYYMLFMSEIFAHRIADGSSDDGELFSCYLNEFLGLKNSNCLEEEDFGLKLIRSADSFYLSHPTSRPNIRMITKIKSPDARALAGHFFCKLVVGFPEDYKPSKVYKAFNFFIHYVDEKGYLSRTPKSRSGYLVSKPIIELIKQVSEKQGCYDLARIASL